MVGLEVEPKGIPLVLGGLLRGRLPGGSQIP